MVVITDCIKALTILVHQTLIENTLTIFALLPSLTVSVQQTLAPVVSVTDGGGVSTVGIIETSCDIKL